MTRTRLLSLACALAANLALAGAAIAQQAQPPSAGAPPQPMPQAGGPPPGGPGGPGGPPPGTSNSDGRPYPVLFVTSVEVLRSERNGGMDIVRARGIVPSNLWGDPHLLPISHGKPSDGILDLLLQARSPDGISPAAPFMVIETLLPIAEGHPFKGVRVRGSSNVVTLKTMPGYADTPAPKEDCAKCVGKFFQAKGAAAPAGAGASDIVREEDLPYVLRIIKPTDGIPHYEHNPNRLTIVLTEDSRILAAAWD